jgi:hypothetical protein
MSGWIWFLITWMSSIPTWGFFYLAWRFRHLRDRGIFRYYLLRGVMFLAGYGVMAASFLFPSLDVPLWLFPLLVVVVPILAMLMLRKGAKRLATDSEEARRYEEAIDLFKQ